ncbi:MULTISPECIES: PTS sugar transporter subunit IIA [Enterococcus]|uniref:PTS system, fructose-specific IIA component n=1 Tax=Candidatus Enterococcus mangumiae TaxID=2230878 RepID=A0ABZ2T184_9ENTE|nr:MULTISPECIES: fructose PTS transporter subunit IIA [unclassified Enterococcus]MBO0491045.1 PTS sugar transporter subunit IIA [Enterococcus sp. DIV1094]MBO1299205.1 PTS sugar transporter subunit IIA [Enterococcus sp. DIV1271a]
MSIATLLPSNHIFLDMESTNKEDTIHQLGEVLTNNGLVSNKEAYIQSVLEREQHSTTGIGNNIAIPHGKSEAVIEPSIVFARLKQPIDWQSLDEEPVSVVILLAIPESQKGDTHLRILSEIAMKLMDDEITAQLKTETNKEQIAKLLSE